MARSLKKFRERATALEQQRDDIDNALIELREACNRLERRLTEIRPDLLPRAADYEQVLRARLDGHADAMLGK
jgi:ABC-type transporter Mla subunit MlaD